MCILPACVIAPSSLSSYSYCSFMIDDKQRRINADDNDDVENEKERESELDPRKPCRIANKPIYTSRSSSLTTITKLFSCDIQARLRWREKPHAFFLLLIFIQFFC